MTIKSVLYQEIVIYMRNALKIILAQNTDTLYLMNMTFITKQL